MTDIIFFGSDEYSAIVLDKLSRSGIGITAVITTQSIPQKKEVKIGTNPVEKYAKTHKLKVFYYPPNIHNLSNLITNSTIGISASFGRILTPDILHLFASGIYNLHPSLLPQYRNVAPVPYALAMGDQVTGITIFKMDEKIDNGAAIAQAEDVILPTDTTPTLLKRLFSKGADILINWLDKPTFSPTHHSVAQQNEGWIFTHKLTRESGYIEWSLFEKYLAHKNLSLSDTTNPLVSIRLTHFPDRNNGAEVVNDLFRALTGYEKLWTTTPKGLDVFITSLTPLMFHLPGKPKPIPYADFQKYYL